MKNQVEETDKAEYPEELISEDKEESHRDIMTKSDIIKMLDKLLDEEAVPAETRKKLWGMTDKEIALTFFTPDDADIAMDMIEDSVLSYITSMKPSEYTFEKDRDLTQLRLKAFAKIKRSVGTDRIKMNERMAIISQLVGKVGTETSQERSAGFFSRLMGRRKE